MTDFVEVKTKAAAEKALAAGKNINIVAGSFALALTNCSLTIQVSGDAAPRVVALESSQPRVVALESSQPRVVAWGSSQPTVEAWGSSQPRVVAWGYSMLQLKGAAIKARASANVTLNLWSGATAEGGRQQVVNLTTAQDWCDYYDVRVEDGCAIVYKAVGAGYRSDWRAIYAPGTMPADSQWDGRKIECSAGGGLNFSPTPRHTHRFVPNPAHYLECRIRLDDEFAVHFDGAYPEKCCHRTVAAPLVEVDIDGNPIASQVEAAA